VSLNRRQLERTDLLTEIESGRRVEVALFQENTRSLNTLTNLLDSRVFSQREDVRKWEKRHAYVPKRDITEAGPNGHGWYCFCRRCEAGIKRLLRDCGVLPKGEPDRARVTAEPVLERLRVPMRYRRDESDK